MQHIRVHPDRIQTAVPIIVSGWVSSPEQLFQPLSILGFSPESWRDVHLGD